MIERQNEMMYGTRYHKDRPADCRLCYYWQNKEYGCVLGKDSCYYLMHEVKTKQQTRCAVCPYSKNETCVTASCYQDLHHWLMEQRRRKAKMAGGKHE